MIFVICASISAKNRGIKNPRKFEKLKEDTLFKENFKRPKI